MRKLLESAPFVYYAYEPNDSDLLEFAAVAEILGFEQPSWKGKNEQALRSSPAGQKSIASHIKGFLSDLGSHDMDVIVVLAQQPDNSFESAGYMLLSYDTIKGYAYLIYTAVVPDYRGKGIIGKLLVLAKELAKANNSQGVLLEVMSKGGHEHAYEVYKHKGFVELTPEEIADLPLLSPDNTPIVSPENLATRSVMLASV